MPSWSGGGKPRNDTLQSGSGNDTINADWGGDQMLAGDETTIYADGELLATVTSTSGDALTAADFILIA